MAYVPLVPRDVSDYDPRAHGARCDLCPLQGKPYVPFESPRKGLKLAIVGMAPGRKESIYRKPFCLVPETLVLMSDLTWKQLGKICVGDRIITLNEHPERTGAGASGYEARRWVIATVTARHDSMSETIQVDMASGGRLTGSSDHRVLVGTRNHKTKGSSKFKWLPLQSLHALESLLYRSPRKNTRGSYVASIGPTWELNISREAGWLAGFCDGEGFVLGSKTKGPVRIGKHGRVGYCQNSGPIAEYADQVTHRLGFELRGKEERRSYSGKTLIRSYIAGGFIDSMRFLGTIRPERLVSDFVHVLSRYGPGHRGIIPDQVTRKSFAGRQPVVDITTTAGTFIANGYVVHNCGPAGQLLDRSLQDTSIDRDECYVTNAALCCPETEEDEEASAACCAPRLARELTTLPKDVPIVAMGKTAAQSILGVKGIFIARGFVWTARDLSKQVKQAEAAVRKAVRYNKDESLPRLAVETYIARNELQGRIVLPTLHPAFILRSEIWTPIFQLDLKRASRIRVTPDGVQTLREGRLEPLDDAITKAESWETWTPKTYLVLESPEDIVRAGSLLGKTVSSDIETEQQTPLSPLRVRMLCGSISDGERTFVIAHWNKDVHAAAYTRALGTRQVVFHNGYNFDQIVLERDRVSFAEATIEDTLIAHHTFASHYYQRLDQVVSTFCDSSPWKIRHGRRGGDEKGLPPQDMPEDDLFFYNAQDSVLTQLSWVGMAADLASEIKVYEHDKELSLQGKRLQLNGYQIDRARRDELSGMLAIEAETQKSRLRELVSMPEFQPTKPADVRKALFGVLKAPILSPTPKGLASTSKDVLEALRASDDSRVSEFCTTLIKQRVMVKIKGTYVDSIDVHEDGRAHNNFRPYGTVSGRYASRILSCPRWSKALEDRVRECYTAASGNKLVYFDLSQAEMRAAAALSGDPNFLEAVKVDAHVGNAKALFPDAWERLDRDPKGDLCPKHSKSSKGGDCNCGKPYRDIAKNAGFAVLYKAEVPKVFSYLRAQGFPVELDQVESMLSSLHSRYEVYYQYIDRNVRFVEKHGYLRTAIVGRKRTFGFHPKPTDVANYPVQTLIADAMNIRLVEIEKRLDREKVPARLVIQHYDAGTFDTPMAYVSVVKKMIEETWAVPVYLPRSDVCDGREFLLPTDVKVKDRWSEMG